MPGKTDPLYYHFSSFHEIDQVIDHMGYMTEWFFDKEKKHTLDVPFLKDMLSQRNTHIDKLISTIDKHCTTFSFERMDPIDKAIFLAWGIEYMVHKTPKQVILNEMIEIAKRYGDEGSSKLINGIWHKVIGDLT
jgi:N utilization substance protein B